ncbi:ABC transporter permease [Microbacterium mitrae]|uniref:ABC transporter permease n=1 Tax=Microbacterium mitrae TaxID=664640 RepID=A0A5C8HRL5_9MICO|nr:ABC transporter permease [Microbacterium mitrae]TXK05683.1 ABC transporter permease [Microbacterium mitrae]
MTLLRKPTAIVSCLFLALVLVAMIAPQMLTARDPLDVDLSVALQPPSAEHLFGTDQTGRDVFTRVIYGARASIGVGLIATGAALIIGLLIGTLIGLAPRWLDGILMRAVDLLLAVPEFVLALIIVAVLGPGPINIAFAVTLSVIPVYIRLARVHTRTLRQSEFVTSARLLGIGSARVLSRHIMPTVLSRLSVLATIGIGTAILSAAGLSFLGLGVTEPAPEWGLMLAGGRNELATAWWIAVFPGLAITAVVIATSVLGRHLRRIAEEGNA